MIDIRGRFARDRCGSRLKEIEALLHLVVVRAEDAAVDREFAISQANLGSLVRSKAAMYTSSAGNYLKPNQMVLAQEFRFRRLLQYSVRFKAPAA